MWSWVRFPHPAPPKYPGHSAEGVARWVSCGSCAHGLPTRESVRKPRTAGGTWSYRLDLGLDDRGRRREREVGGVPTREEAQASTTRPPARSEGRTWRR